MGEVVNMVDDQAVAVGVIVYLKSGSPPLTVFDQILRDDLVCVEWFNGNTVERDAFHKDCLTTTDPSFDV